MKDHPIPQDRHEFAVDHILHALGNAPVPEGLEARLCTGVQVRAKARQYSHANSRTWWRGALAGAAFATLAISAVLLLQHRSKTHADHAATPDIAADRTPATQPVSAVLTAPGRAKPCAPIDMSYVALTHGSTIGSTEHAKKPNPFPEQPLTPEERTLVLLARRTDPKELAILNPEARAKLDAEEAAKFSEFFAPPPPAPSQPALTTPGESE
jgi:hypothetical protein